MDIADLIRSKDVREYVRASNYHFTPLDAALIIFQADKPLKVKHALLKELLKTMPDCKIGKEGISLHATIEKSIKIDEEIIARMFACEEYAHYEVYVRSDRENYYDESYDSSKWRTSASTMQECLDWIDSFKKQATDVFNIVKTIHENGSYDEKDIWRFFIDISADNQIINVFGRNSFEHYSENEISVFGDCDLSEGFPFPFRKGDILTDDYNSVHPKYSLVNICANDYSANGDHYYYQVCVDGKIEHYRVRKSTYLLNMRRVNDKDKIKYRSLFKAISAFLKDELTLDKLLTIYEYHKSVMLANFNCLHDKDYPDFFNEYGIPVIEDD